MLKNFLSLHGSLSPWHTTIPLRVGWRRSWSIREWTLGNIQPTAALGGVSITTILKSAYWSNVGTFKQHYQRELELVYDEPTVNFGTEMYMMEYVFFYDLFLSICYQWPGPNFKPSVISRNRIGMEWENLTKEGTYLKWIFCSISIPRRLRGNNNRISLCCSEKCERAMPRAKAQRLCTRV